MDLIIRPWDTTKCLLRMDAIRAHYRKATGNVRRMHWEVEKQKILSLTNSPRIRRVEMKET